MTKLPTSNSTGIGLTQAHGSHCQPHQPQNQPPTHSPVGAFALGPGQTVRRPDVLAFVRDLVGLHELQTNRCAGHCIDDQLVDAFVEQALIGTRRRGARRRQLLCDDAERLELGEVERLVVVDDDLPGLDDRVVGAARGQK